MQSETLELDGVIDIYDLAQRVDNKERLALTIFAGLCDAGIIMSTDDLADFCEDANSIVAAWFWVEYVQDLAFDCCLTSSDRLAWPNYCIDWQWAARELAHDYWKFYVAGREYYVRAF